MDELKVVKRRKIIHRQSLEAQRDRAGVGGGRGDIVGAKVVREAECRCGGGGKWRHRQSRLR